MIIGVNVEHEILEKQTITLL